MNSENARLDKLCAKDEIRELALLYSRGIDRRDWPLIRSLYTSDGVDTHGEFFHGSADEFITFLEASMPSARWTGHFVANHLISVEGDQGEGEVYVLAYHLMTAEDGTCCEDLMIVRYLDQYRREDGSWKFSSRVVSFDLRSVRPVSTPIHGAAPPAEQDPSYQQLLGSLFARGARR